MVMRAQALNLSGALRRCAIGATAVLLLVVLARPYSSVRGYAVYLAASTVFFFAVVLLLLRTRRFTDRAFEVLCKVSPGVLSILFCAAACVAALLVLHNIPHISDEVAYQFQAKALAQGRLTWDVPPVPGSFGFLHTIMDQEKWYGVFSPGWPALLALGYAVGSPWIVNPVLGALTLLVLFQFCKAAGYTELEARLAVVFLTVSPFVLYMSANFMSHASNLLLFLIFCWGIVRLAQTPHLGYAAVAGAALGWNLLVRPVDSAVTAIPFGLFLAKRAWEVPRLRLPVLVLILLSTSIGGLTLPYNRHLTGDALLHPVTKYFNDAGIGSFSLGFGADIGTKIHGDEWPGYYPADAVRVSSYRLSELFRDLHGLPILLPILALAAPWRKRDASDTWHHLMSYSALLLFAAYGLHFYHGIAFGARHYYLAVPAIALLAARLSARGLAEQGAVAQLGRAAVVGLVVHALVFPLPLVTAEYARAYRSASPAFRDLVREHKMQNAVLFVDESNWGWKSAFPLNDLPIGTGSVIYAKDLPENNARVMEKFPGRRYYDCRMDRDLKRAECGPAGAFPEQAK